MGKVIRSVFIFSLVLVLVSCEYWNKDMLGYLEYWSSTVQMGRIELTGVETQTNSSNIRTIPVSSTPIITGYIINPQGYSLVDDIGDDSTPNIAVRVSDPTVQSKTSMVAQSLTMLQVKLDAADDTLEHRTVTVNMEAIRSDTMVSAGVVMGVTFQYNTPPAKPMPVVKTDTGGYKLVSGGAKWEASDDGTLYWAYYEETVETKPNCAKSFKINGQVVPVTDCNPVEGESSLSGLTLYSKHTGSASTSVAAVDSVGVTGSAIVSGQVAPARITYNGNKNSGGAVPAPQSFEKGTQVTIADEGNLTREGYTFAGWSERQDGSGTTYTAGQTVSFPGDTILYAKWTPNTYTITFNDNQGSGGPGSLPVTYDQTPPSITNSLPSWGIGGGMAGTSPTYTFMGYYTNRNGTGTQYYDEKGNPVAGPWKKTQNIILYAKWTPNTYTVTFDRNGGSGSMADQRFSYGTQQKLTKNQFTRTGYTFVGWDTKKDGAGKRYSDQESVLNLTSENGKTVTLYAQWEYEEPKKQGDVYQVANAGNLLWISEALRDGTIKKFDLKLTANIEIPKDEWKPIHLPDHQVATFDGQGYSITFSNSTEGLFDRFNYSTVKNLVLKGSITVSTSDYVGALGEDIFASTIENVMSLVNITNNGTGHTGGLVGLFGGKDGAIIRNCAVYGNVTGKGNTGGLVGALWDDTQTGKILNSVYMGTVSGSPKGAVVGKNGNGTNSKSTLQDIFYCANGVNDVIGDRGNSTPTEIRVVSKTKEQIKNEALGLLGNQWELKSGDDRPTLKSPPLTP